MDGVAKFGAVANAVGEEAGELFHLADGVGHFSCDQAAEISGKQMIAVEFGGLVVASASQRIARSGGRSRDSTKRSGRS